MSALPSHLVPTPPTPATLAPRLRLVSAQAPRSEFRGRALHLIDLENLTGGPDVSDDLAGFTWGCYRYGVATTATDQFWVGSCTHFVKRAMTVLPAQGISLLVRDGEDGAESALIDAADLDFLAARFQRLVIGSGDGKFVPLARAARAAGLHVHQVTGLGHPASALLTAATTRARLRFPMPIAVPRPRRGARPPR